MFGSFGLANLLPKAKVAPEDIPPPTPICLPRYQPFVQDDIPVDPEQALSNLLKYTGRASATSGSIGLSAIGFDLKLDVEAEELIPIPSFMPDFEKWDRLTPEEAREQNQAERRPIRNGNFSPPCQVYVERRRELSNTNEDAFRTVRRLAPPKGRQQARLGNAYEFFRCLEFFTTYWEDPSRPPSLPPSPELAPSENGEETNTAQESPRCQATRTSDGSSMPPEYRQNLISAFIKLVAYDFGCNVSMARVEPRLQLSSPKGHPSPRKSYSPSACHFLFQSPTTRETARAGLVYGPLGAVSTRPGINFTTPDIETAQSTDLAREVLAALITAQHRAREEKVETPFGEDQWWTSKPRWGGGTGGPIGREIDMDMPPVDKDAAAADSEKAVRPPAKRPRKTMSIYDAYRMVHPPAFTWDKKARYEAVGRQKGVDYDDVFVISSIFHHISILRVRVPDRLLEVLGGSPDPDVTRRSWGRVQGWRSRWFDLFDIEQRLLAMQMLWAVMAYQMRKEPEEKDLVMVDK
ncbi:hypothetical protein V8C37DRAFT_185179 [Trichoderma ceciliae]